MIPEIDDNSKFVLNVYFDQIGGLGTSFISRGGNKQPPPEWYYGQKLKCEVIT